MCEAELGKLKGQVSPLSATEVNISLSVTNKSSRQKISNDTVDLKNTINQLDLIGVYRIWNIAFNNSRIHILLELK